MNGKAPGWIAARWDAALHRAQDVDHPQPRPAAARHHRGHGLDRQCPAEARAGRGRGAAPCSPSMSSASPWRWRATRYRFAPRATRSSMPAIRRRSAAVRSPGSPAAPTRPAASPSTATGRCRAACRRASRRRRRREAHGAGRPGDDPAGRRGRSKSSSTIRTARSRASPNIAATSWPAPSIGRRQDGDFALELVQGDRIMPLRARDAGGALRRGRRPNSRSPTANMRCASARAALADQR